MGAALAFFTSSFLFQPSGLCTSLQDANPLVMDPFEPLVRLLLLLVRARYFPISLGDYSYFLLTHDASRKNTFPQPVETLWEWASNHRSQRQGAGGKTRLEQPHSCSST